MCAPGERQGLVQQASRLYGVPAALSQLHETHQRLDDERLVVDITRDGQRALESRLGGLGSADQEVELAHTIQTVDELHLVAGSQEEAEALLVHGAGRSVVPATSGDQPEILERLGMSRQSSATYDPTGTMTCVRERTCGANWYQPRMAWNSGVVMAPGPSIS